MMILWMKIILKMVENVHVHYRQRLLWKKSPSITRNLQNDREDGACYRDRIKLSHTHELVHCKKYFVDLKQNKQLLTLKSFLRQYHTTWQDLKTLESIQVYVQQTSMQQYEEYENIAEFHPKDSKINIYVILL